MIELTRMNGDVFYINPHLIEKMEERTDTVIITMDSQVQYVVKERGNEIINKIIKYRKSLNEFSQE